MNQKKLLLFFSPVLLVFILSVGSCRQTPYYYKTSLCVGREEALSFFDTHKKFIGVIDLNNYRKMDIKNINKGEYSLSLTNPDNLKDIEKYKIITCKVKDQEIIEQIYSDNKFVLFKLQKKSLGAKLLLQRMDLRKLKEANIEYFKSPGSFKSSGSININNLKEDEKDLLKSLRTDMAILLLPVKYDEIKQKIRRISSETGEN